MTTNVLMSSAPPATAEKKPAASQWRITPTDAEVRNEMIFSGSNYTSAREKVEAQLQADAEILSSAMPGVVQEIQSARTAADQADQAATELLDESRAVIAETQARLAMLGATRAKVASLRAVILPPEEELQAGRRAVELLLHRAAAPWIAQDFEASVRDLAWRKTLAPHIPPLLAEFEAQSAALEKEILATARQHGLDVPALLHTMRRGGTHSRQEVLGWDSVHAFDNLLP